MRTKICFLALTLAFSVLTLQAQREETVLGTRNLGFSGVWGGTKHQISRFGNANQYVHGWHFGFEFGKAFTVGFGGYNLHDDILWDNVPGQRFDMNWRTFNLGYAIQGFRAVHPMINLDAGRGKVKLIDEGIEDRVFIVQPSAGIEINVFRWLHLGLEGGYRFVTDSDLVSLNDRQLSGAVGQATLKFGFSWGRFRKSQHD